jgi:DNA ligase-1
VKEEEEYDSDKEASESESEGASDVIGDEKDTVNCHPSRPSSAFVITNESPPIWFKPLEVFEVSFADMSLSRQHTAAAGLVDDPEGRGVALRFPRFKRRRPDKRPDQATTCTQIAHLFANQSKQGTSARRTASR